MFALSQKLMCLGLGAEGARNLTPVEVARIEGIASALHRGSDWEVPPDPARLAEIASVCLGRIPIGEDVEALFTDSVALYRGLPDPRDDGLAAAFALASVLVIRRGLGWSPVFRWRLAAELLVPAWALGTSTVEHLAATHPSAPSWLVWQSLRVQAAASADK